MNINGGLGRSGSEHDRDERAVIVLECEVRQGSRPWKRTRLEDLSSRGFRIAWYPDCRAEIPLRIRIPGLELLTAHVRWQRDQAVGCEFSAPLYTAVFEHIVAKARQG